MDSLGRQVVGVQREREEEDGTGRLTFGELINVAADRWKWIICGCVYFHSLSIVRQSQFCQYLNVNNNRER